MRVITGCTHVGCNVHVWIHGRRWIFKTKDKEAYVRLQSNVWRFKKIELLLLLFSLFLSCGKLPVHMIQRTRCKLYTTICCSHGLLACAFVCQAPHSEDLLAHQRMPQYFPVHLWWRMCFSCSPRWQIRLPWPGGARTIPVYDMSPIFLIPALWLVASKVSLFGDSCVASCCDVLCVVMFCALCCTVMISANHLFSMICVLCCTVMISANHLFSVLCVLCAACCVVWHGRKLRPQF